MNVPGYTYPNEFWNSREEHEAHIRFWKSLNHQQKIRWIFAQLYEDENGIWHRRTGEEE